MTDYVKQRATWADLPSTTTPIRASDLIGIEAGIANVSWALPSYARPRPAYWQPDRSIYNLKASNTRFLRAGTTGASAGLALCRIACVGDSIMAGYLGTPGDTDPVTMFLRMLVRRGQLASPLLHTWDGITGDYVGVNTASNTGGGGENSTFPWTLVTTGSITYSGSGTVLDIVSASGNGAPFFYSIDGGAQVSVNVTGAGNHAVMTTVTGLADGAHTVTVSRNGGSGNIYFLAAGFRYPTGIVVENAGITGTTTSDWVAQDGNYGALWSLLTDTANPRRDAAFVALGVNDFLTAIPVATTRSNLATICQRLKAVNTDPILMVENRPQNASGWDAYAAAVYDVADSEDVPLLDMTDWFGTAATMVTNGHDIGDQVHLTAKGSAHQAEALGETVLAEPDALSKNVFVGLNGLSPFSLQGRKTTPGAPTTGTWNANDVIIDSVGVVWICTAAGTPGNWSSESHDVQIFNANGTWTKPAGAKTVQGYLFGSGGSGQAGARRASGTVATGGSSGSGAGYTFFECDASVLGSTQAVVVGATATGGAGATANDTAAGANGVNGAETTFAGFRAGGGLGGNLGTTAGTGTYAGGSGVTGTSAAGASSAVTNSNGCPGGGSGGGISATPAASTGGAGARMNSVATTVAVGAAGAIDGAGGGGSGPQGWHGGTSGGGGGSSITGAGGNGGNGGAYGTGGGGGGASLNGFTSGAGGNGGPGIAVIITKF